MYIYGVNVDAGTLTAYQAAYKKLYISISIHRKNEELNRKCEEEGESINSALPVMMELM